MMACGTEEQREGGGGGGACTTGGSVIQHITVKNENNVMHISSKASEVKNTTIEDQN